MSQKIIKNDQINDFEELASDIQNNLLNRTINIQDRIENIELKEEKPKLKEKEKWWEGIFSKSDSIAKGTAGITAKSLINVELLASQEEESINLRLNGLNLLDKIRAGKKISKEVEGDTAREMLNLMKSINDELSERIDIIEGKLDNIQIENSVNKIEDIKFPDKITNIGDAYKVMEDIYQNLSKRLDKVEEELSKTEVTLKQDIGLGIIKNKKPIIPEGEEPKKIINTNKKQNVKLKEKNKKKNRGIAL